MNITLNGIKITQDTRNLAFEKNNNVDEIVVTVDTDESWSYKLDVKYPDKYNIGNDTLYNIIDLDRNGNICSVVLTSEMLPFNGKYTMQLRGINGDKVYHSDTFEVWVKYSIEPGSTYNPVPSEFYQVEARLDDKVDEAKQYAENAEIASTRMPKISPDNTWLIWDAEIGGYVDTGIVASGGTTDHSKLINRDAADQHPMSAITGLEDALDSKQPTGNYLTEEMDPTVPEWAKQPQKPAYTAQEVGALPDTTAIPSTAADVNAEPSGAVSQHNVSDVAHSDIRLLVKGLADELDGKQPTGNYLTDKDLDATLAVEGKAADAKVVGDALSAFDNAIIELSEAMLTKESDPTVPSWAKEPTKPSYTAAEIGAQPDMYVSHFGLLLNNLAVKTVVYVAASGGTSPIPDDRYPVLFMRGGINMGYASIVAYDAAGKTWTGSVNFARGTINLSERTLTASDIGAIPIPATAKVGQTIVVKAVDADGKPTEWETQDMASGSADSDWKLIRKITVPDDPSSDTSGIAWVVSNNAVKSIDFDTDDNGEAFSVKELYIATTATNIDNQTAVTEILATLNGKNKIIHNTNAALVLTCGKTGESGRAWMYIRSLNPPIILTAPWITTNTVAGKAVQCVNELVGFEENRFDLGEKITKISLGGYRSTSYISAGSVFEVYGR